MKEISISIIKINRDTETNFYCSFFGVLGTKILCSFHITSFVLCHICIYTFKYFIINKYMVNNDHNTK